MLRTSQRCRVNVNPRFFLGLILSEVFNYAQIETILVYVYGKYSAGEGSKLISDGYEEEHFRPILELLTDEEIGEFLREYLPGRLANELHAKKVILEW